MKVLAIHLSSHRSIHKDYRSNVIVQKDNLTTSYTPNQYLNSLMLGDAADYKDFPDIRFNQNTTNNIVLA
ncbi:MAG TPA: hypothetical protein VE971_04335, partial [Candidatus Eisenbacteria bacterium]|nr:hypothetical protein [Candidatus Eisenbacteria bacterium]